MILLQKKFLLVLEELWQIVKIVPISVILPFTLITRAVVLAKKSSKILFDFHKGIKKSSRMPTLEKKASMPSSGSRKEQIEHLSNSISF